MSANDEVEVLVVGSGPGGAMTSALLAEAGYAVTLLEQGEGQWEAEIKEFSISEMLYKYKSSGMTIALGNPKISYVEGQCVGGGSEVNAGLYYRTPATVINDWKQKYGVVGLEPEDCERWFALNEHDVDISYMPKEKVPVASLKLHQGAQALGWESSEVPRWYSYDKSLNGIKQSMSKTFIPRAVKANVTIQTTARVDKIKRNRDIWDVEAEIKGEKKQIRAKYVFICAGAVATPHLLKKNGLSQLAGKKLHMHPSVKLVAQFPEQVNGTQMGVPVHQVKEFSPRLSLGCSISSRPYLQLAMFGVPNGKSLVDINWEKMAVYYVMSTDGVGSVQNLPFIKAPLVKFELGKKGAMNLKEGLIQLGKCLFEAGAEVVYPSVLNSTAIDNLEQLRLFVNNLPESSLNPMTIHLFSSCPMGERKDLCVTNSYGKVHGQENLYVNDASLICTALGVNPQGTVMMLARRNVEKFLEETKSE